MADAGPAGDAAGRCVPALWPTPTRRQILRLVRSSELPAGQIAAHFAHLTQQAISQHLRVLAGAGLPEHRAGTRRFTLRPDPLDQVRAVLASSGPTPCRRRRRARPPTDWRHTDRPDHSRPTRWPASASRPVEGFFPTSSTHRCWPAGSATPRSDTRAGRRLRAAFNDSTSVQGKFCHHRPAKRWCSPGESPTTTSRFDHRRNRAHPDGTRPSSTSPTTTCHAGSTQPQAGWTGLLNKLSASPETTGDAVPTSAPHAVPEQGHELSRCRTVAASGSSV
jgi:hypothetical protein